jgi:hypothetical protein
VTYIPGLEMAPINIMAQNTIDKLGRVIPKNRLTHDQSWKWSSRTSVNSRVQKELFQACGYSFCIRRLINWAVAVRQKYPGKKHLASKIHYKLAHHCGTLHFLMALKTATQLPENDLAIITDSHLAAPPALLSGE